LTFSIHLSLADWILLDPGFKAHGRALYIGTITWCSSHDAL